MRKSALFVDFDNIYLTLKDQDPEHAIAFATQPGRWLHWLERFRTSKSLGEGFHRRILIRKCYLNPTSFYEFRPYFIKAAFEVIDCPQLTRQGKTATDIHMVMDMLETLNHPTHFDEFIILSGDSDFTPVLIKLREYDRRTMVLSTGFTSPAYKSASDFTIYSDVFLRWGLGISEDADIAETPPQFDFQDAADKATQVITDRVAESPVPVSMATLAQAIQAELGMGDKDCDWFGYDRFTTFVTSLDLGPIRIVKGGPGYALDPHRHKVPQDAELNPFEEDQQELADFARKVSALTDTPFLSPDDYKALFEAIADEVNRNGYGGFQTSKAVRDAMVQQEIAISRNQINFVLIGAGRAGYRFANPGPDSPKDIASAFAKNVHNLCSSAQFTLGKDQQLMLMSWLIKK